MTMLYATWGMAEAMFIFFALASVMVFLRWAETRRTALLPLLGVMAGLGGLTRMEFNALAVALGIAVAVKAVRRGASWREVETHVLLYALPGIFLVGLWIGSLAILERNPLFFAYAGTGRRAKISSAI